jgi:hypothetical protein
MAFDKMIIDNKAIDNKAGGTPALPEWSVGVNSEINARQQEHRRL